MPERAATLIAEERAALLGFLANVEGEPWSTPTAWRGWTVKEVVAHLVENELALGRVIRRETDEWRVTDETEEAGIGNWRPLPGVAVRSALWQHGLAAQRLMDSLSDEAWDRAVPLEVAKSDVRFRGRLRLRDLARLRLFDSSVHGHDVTEALGGEPIWGKRLPYLAEFVIRAAPGLLTGAGVPPDGALAVTVEGSEPRTLDGRAGAWALTDDEAPVTVTTSPETLVLAAAGRLTVAELLAASKVEGDAASAERILTVVRLF